MLTPRGSLSPLCIAFLREAAHDPRPARAARALLLSGPQSSKIRGRLQSRGLVHVERVRRGHSQLRVTLTPAGRALLEGLCRD